MEEIEQIAESQPAVKRLLDEYMLDLDTLAEEKQHKTNKAIRSIKIYIAKKKANLQKGLFEQVSSIDDGFFSKLASSIDIKSVLDS